MQGKLLSVLVRGFVPAGLLITASLQLVHAQGASGGVQFIEPGQPPVVIHSTVEVARRVHAAHGGGGPSTGNNLYLHGGAVETAPKIYLVLWGSQWSNNDQ